jgi:hypothetical protein
MTTADVLWYFFLFLLLSLVTYRVGRFVVLDDLISGLRNSLLTWLERPGKEREKPPPWSTLRDAPPLWRHKVSQLLGCPFCVTVWVAGGAVAVTHFLVDPLPVPVWWWLGVAGAAVLPWAITDSE